MNKKSVQVSRMMDEFVERNLCVKKWLEEKARKSEATAKIYKHLSFHFYLWLKENTDFQDMQSLLNDFKAKKRQDEEFQHNDLVKRYVLSDRMKLKSKGHRHQALSVIKSFYEYNRCALPKEKIDLTIKDVDAQRVREKLGLKPMTIQDLEHLVAPMKIREKAMLTINVESGMGVGEFSKQFNVCTCRKEYLQRNGHVCEPAKVMRQLRENQFPIKVDLVMRKNNPNPYFTFIGRDGVELLKRYLTFRAELIKRAQNKLKQLEELERQGSELKGWRGTLLQHYREKLQHLTPEWSPGEPIFITNQLNPVTDQSFETTVNLYKRLTGLKDREFTPHTCRDIFKTECAHAGVDNVISEYFIGHSLDTYGYNKLDKMYPEDFVKEYSKVEPALNIISHTGRPIVSVEEVKSLQEKVKSLETVVQALTEVMTPEQIQELFKARTESELKLPKGQS